MSYRPGDVPTRIGRLRLTVSGLAEIAARLRADSPSELAETLRGSGPDEARHLLSVLLRPSGMQGELARLTDQDVASLMPDVSRCIVTALCGGETR